jgi:hypothetical protein
MATLRHIESGIDHPLAARSLVGRSRNGQVRIDVSAVSATHAEITWDGQRWHLRDLSSTNGTFVEGHRIAAAHQVALEPGVRIGFGAPTLDYCFVDAAAPRLMAFGPARVVLAEGDMLCLPSAEEPELLIFRESNDQWVIEGPETARPIEDEECVVVRGMPFFVHLPGRASATQDVNDVALDDGALEFTVSHDGETVDLRIVHGSRVRHMEHRAFSPLLLELARARIADMAQPHLTETEHGWMHRNDVMSNLGEDEPQLINLWVYRARAHFARMKLRGAARIIERREGAGQLRIGVRQLSITNA